jgi:hypothetical protein
VAPGPHSLWSEGILLSAAKVVRDAARYHDYIFPAIPTLIIRSMGIHRYLDSRLAETRVRDLPRCTKVNKDRHFLTFLRRRIAKTLADNWSARGTKARRATLAAGSTAMVS